jgi:hypothetical protein
MIIEKRYNGPEGSGNGGWTAGTVGTLIDGPATVTLRVPPPLDVPYAIERRDGGIQVYGPDGVLIATAEHADVEREPIEPVGYDEAEALSREYPGFTSHPFPTCFVCGPQRAPGDGLRLFTGRRANGDTATPWIVPDDVSTPMVWASLDCPGGWSVGIEDRPYLLGRIATRVERVPEPGDRCVVMGRLLGIEGRKAQVAAVLTGPDGEALAWARATWIAFS